MPDVFTTEKRSQVMSRIRGRDNKDTEIVLARLFRANGISGWRRHQKLIGKPDFTFRKQRVVIFVDGCFWHGCPKHSNMPVNNQAFWEKKLTGNRSRDLLVTKSLRAAGWRVLRIWEHELGRKQIQRVLRRIESALAAADKKRVPS